MYKMNREKTALEEVEAFIANPFEYKGDASYYLKIVAQDADNVATQLLEAKRILTFIASTDLDDDDYEKKLRWVIDVANASLTVQDFRVYTHKIEEMPVRDKGG